VNIDFSQDATFSWYVVLLMISGLLTLGLAAAGASSQTRGMRIVQALLGLGFFGYGFYLAFIFQGGHYIMFFRAFIVPVLLLVNFVRTKAAKRRSRSA